MNQNQSYPLFALDFDIVREAFIKSVVELAIPEDRWAAQARRLLMELADNEPDEEMIGSIIGQRSHS
ncbi:hypothetical protein [Mesorhizobium sp. INR15]|uniref:hypothetical protein n=1 Tax=Mesorhizobium sp. INR15 TaxID=2654248 RepID=UPI0018967D8B|nr:hypothetical protein [Mesorhizobium sp. INR15]QPC93017.1 hypothetical protein GA829_21940 [Mesorhizobium sp. INR15]